MIKKALSKVRKPKKSSGKAVGIWGIRRVALINAINIF
jgi:hypothetical protein